MSETTIPIKEVAEDAKALIKKIDDLIIFYSVKARRAEQSCLTHQAWSAINMVGELNRTRKTIQELINAIEK